jgi:hypothetical protein
MGLGLAETELEVTGWLDSLADDDFGQAERCVEEGHITSNEHNP